jgi:hypothetical protein
MNACDAPSLTTTLPFGVIEEFASEVAVIVYVTAELAISGGATIENTPKIRIETTMDANNIFFVNIFHQT